MATRTVTLTEAGLAFIVVPGAVSDQFFLPRQDDELHRAALIVDMVSAATENVPPPGPLLPECLVRPEWRDTYRKMFTRYS